MTQKIKSRRLLWPSFAGATVAFLFLSFGGASCTRALCAATTSWSASSALVTPGFAMADFDRDGKPDFVDVRFAQHTGVNTRYCIAFHLANGSRYTVGITAPTGGLRLAIRDVNGDHSPDVVVTTMWTNQPVAVLLNDGHGALRASSPSHFPGAFSASNDALSSVRDHGGNPVAVIFSRELFGRFVQARGISKPHYASGVCVPRDPRPWRLYAAESSFGRSPPLSYS